VHQDIFFKAISYVIQDARLEHGLTVLLIHAIHALLVVILVQMEYNVPYQNFLTFTQID
jgi:hypothetical protein